MRGDKKFPKDVQQRLKNLEAPHRAVKPAWWNQYLVSAWKKRAKQLRLEAQRELDREDTC